MRGFFGCVLLLVLLGCVQQSAVYLAPQANSAEEEELIKVDPPIYPTVHREIGVEGFVVMEYSVNEQGQVENARVVEDKPEGIFRQAALVSLYSSVYKPRYEDGKPVRVDGKLRRVLFTLEGGSASYGTVRKMTCDNTYSRELLERRNCEKIQ